MLLWILIVACIILGVLATIMWQADCEGAAICMIFVAIIIICSSAVILVDNYYDATPANIEKYKTTYNSIIEQVNQDFDGVAKQQVMARAAQWNADLTYRKNITKDFWVGSFYPNIYDQFELIEME